MDNISSLKIAIDSSDAKKASNELNNLTNTSSKAEKGVNTLRNAFATIGAGALAKQFIDTADNLKLLDARLKLATDSTKEFKSQQEQLLKISLQSYTAYSDTVTLFTKLNPALKQVGASTEQVNSVVSSFVKGLQLGGSSAAEASSAILQFSQAMGSGVLRGEEFNAIAEASPKLMSYLAKGMGVAQTELRKMAENGELTASRVSNALLKVKDKIDTDFATLPVTVAKAMTNLSTVTGQFIQDVDSATGATSAIAKQIENLSNTINSISPEELENLLDLIKNTGIALAGGYIAIKSFNQGLELYQQSVNKSNEITALNTKIQEANKLAIESGEKALQLRILADKVAETGMINGEKATKAQVSALNAEAKAAQLAAETNTANSYALQSTAKGFNLAAVASNTFKMALNTIPFMVIVTGLTAIATAISATSKSAETLSDTLNMPIEKLKELTKNQLAYRKSILETAIAEQKWEVRKKEMRAGANGLFDTPQSKKEQLAALDDEKQKLKDMQFTYEDIIDVANSYNKTVSKGTEANLQNKRNETEITKLAGSELSKYLLDVEEGVKKLKEIGATETEIQSFRDKKSKEFAEKRQSENKKLSDDAKKIAEEGQKAKDEMSKVGLSDYSLAVQDITQKTQEWIKAGADYNEVIAKQKQLLEELNLQNSLSIASEQLSFLEKKAQLMTDEYEKAKLLLEISYAKNLVDIQGRNIPTEDKQRLIEQETELYNLTKERIELDRNTEYQEIMKTFYDDMIESQINLNEAVYNFGSGFDDVGSKISKVSKSLAAMTNLELTNKKEVNKLDKKYEKEFTKYAGDVQKTKELEQQYTKDTALLNEANIINQINGYANIAGAMSGMFQEGSKEAAAFRMVESGLAIASGVRAILTQGSGDPYTAFARMAAMAASVSTLLSSAGIAFGMNKTTTSSDAFSSQSANEGKGSVLGDSKKASESITNALNTLEDFAQPQYDTLLSMNDYLANISNNIGGVTKLLIQNAGYALGEGYTGFDSGFKNNVSSFGLDKVNLFDKLTGTSFMGNTLNSIIGGLFGKSSVSQALTDSGITFADQLLTSAIKQFEGQSFQTISTTVKNKSWFGSSGSTSINSYFQDLDAETERQFTLVLDGLYQTVLTAGLALDKSKEETTKSLEGFRVALGKISLKDKSGQEIQELLSNAFSKVGDEIAKASFPLLQSFQQVGEGLFETLTRVATGMEEAEFYIDRLGNKFSDVVYTAIGNKSGDVGFEALLQSITNVEKRTYPLNNNLLKVVSSLDLTAEQLYAMYTNLDELRDRLIFLKQEAQGLSSSMIKGAGSVGDLDSGFKSFFENFLTESEQLTYETEQLTKQFNNLGIALPISKDGFKDLLKSMDLTTESGQELYGRLIILSESFASVADKTAESIKKLEDELSELTQGGFNKFTDTLKGVFDSIVNMAKNTQQAILNIKIRETGNTKESEYNQLVQYYKLISDFEEANKSTDKTKASEIYSNILSLGNTLAGKGYESQVLNVLENNLAGFNVEQDVIRVNIVDGLGTLLGLNQEQVTQLKEVAKDGVITNGELNSIKGLTQVQKDGIIDFANNSEYFSTESTLYSLNEYMKKQLEVLQKTQAEETVGLSSKSFAYGDYIGKQEQIDISKRLGVSYETAKPLIERLQALSISKNPYEDIKKMVGFNGEDFTDWNNWNQLVAFDPESPVNIGAIGNQIYSEGQNAKNARLAAEKAAAEKATFLQQYQAAINAYSKEKNESDLQLNAFKGILSNIWAVGKLGNYGEIQEDITKGTAFKAYNYVTANGYTSANNQTYSAYITEFKQAKTAYATLQKLEAEKKLKGYAVGSTYIENDQIAKIHQGEIITPKNFSDGLRNGDLVMGQTANMVTAINNMGALVSQNVANLESKLNSIISLSNGQLNQLMDIRDINNESLVSLQNMEVII